MTYDQLMDCICRSSAADWLHISEAGAHTFRGDLNIQIRRIETEAGGAALGSAETAALGFSQTVTQQVLKLRGQPIQYEIRYASSIVERFLLLSVDGGNARIPIPEADSNRIAWKHYRFAKALDYLGTLDNYLKHAGFKVEPEPVAVLPPH